MSEIRASLVKELRDRTGVGMAKCKEALEQSGGDLDAAVSFLRKLGMASAVKKEGRSTKEGSVSFHEDSAVVAIVEVDAETDFVVQNEKFKEFCRNLAEEAVRIRPESLEAFMQHAYSKDPQITMDQYRSLLIQTIGENIVVRRVTVLPKRPGESIGVYSHLGGKLLTAVVLQGAGEELLAREIGMHIAAAAPEYVAPTDVPQELVDKEREIARAQVQGKPEHVLAKILEGKLQSFFDTVCLTRQQYIKDDSLSVEELVRQRSRETGKQIVILQFLRWVAGK